MTPLLLASLSAAASLASWVAYMAMVPSGSVPARPVGHIVVQLLSIGAAGVAVASGQLLALAPAAVALTMGLLFLFLLTQRKTPVGDLRVGVGDSMLPFTALDRHGKPFTVGDLHRKRTLFKFFRGHW